MSEQQQLEKVRIWNSKLARRIVPIAVALVAVPIVLTVLILGKVGRDQIVNTADEMGTINTDALTGAGAAFQRLGRQTLRTSMQESSETSAQAVHGFSARQQVWQSQYLRSTAQDFNKLTRASLADSTNQSLRTHQQILKQVSEKMGSIYSRSTRDAQDRAVKRVETAMMTQIETVMQGRADELAEQVTQNIRSHQNYLALTAQMPDFLDGHVDGQKAILDALVRRYPMLTLVSAIDASGHETAMSASDHIVTASDLGDRSKTPYFQTAMKDEPYLGLEELPTGGAPILRIATPIEKYRGRAVGALTARMSLGDAWDLLQAARIGDTGFAYVTDPKGAYLLRPRQVGSRTPQNADLLMKSADLEQLHWRIYVAEPRAEVVRPIQALQRDIAENGKLTVGRMRVSLGDASRTAEVKMQKGEAQLENAAAAQVESHTRLVFDRFRSQTSQQTAAELGKMQSAIQAQAQNAEHQSDMQMDAATKSSLALMQHRTAPLTQSALNEANTRLSVFGLWIMVVSCVIGMIVALLITAAIVRPVILLAQGTRSIAQGDLEKRVDERAPGEIKDLAAAFNTMAESLMTSRNELQHAETQLVHSAKLASLGTLSAGVAHELNQPLAIIRGISQQLQDEPGVTDPMREDLELIEGQTTRMMKIVKHLRTFSRAGSYEKSTIDINQSINDCFILVGAQLKAHNVEVDLDLSDEGAFVLGDSNELEQVFLNLITNARDALDEIPDAKLTIRTRLQDDQVIAEFADNGPGIPPDVAAHIFDPFFTTKEPGKGTGLGLSISHGIIDKHEGKISVRNEGGAVFQIILPRAEQETEASSSVPKAA
jgi:C4-dicarboxylate-specific signal transduction histidine kinase